jgi:hypothetical protein
VSEHIHTDPDERITATHLAHVHNADRTTVQQMCSIGSMTEIEEALTEYHDTLHNPEGTA